MEKEKNKKELQYWLRLLESYDFNRRSNYGEDYGLWFYKGPFYLKIEKFLSNDLKSFTFIYDGITTEIDFFEENIDEIEIVIKAMADTMLLPLCVNIEWFQLILSEFLTQEKVIV